ncbi:MAG TPA: DUF4349 domain-containing protein [Myxococcales bacterium]|jgi:hypothetical protein
MGRTLAVVLFALVGGCSRAEDFAAPVTADRSLALTLDTSIQIADVHDAGRRVRSEVGRLGGFVLDSGSYGDSDIHFALRVPSARLPEFRTFLAGVGKVVREAEKTEDVTDQRVDLGARLRNAQVQEQRLLRLLEERTGSLADVVAIEKELASVREAIERLDAQSKALASRVELAAVSLDLSQHAPAWKTPIASLGSAARSGLEAVAGLGVGVGMVVAATAPTLLALAGLGLGLWRVLAAMKRWRARALAAR